MTVTDPGDWIKNVFVISIHYKNSDGGLGFPVIGGAERGEFLQVGPLSIFDVAYYGRTHDSMLRKMFPKPSKERNVLKLGDIILETDGWSCVGLRTREYLSLTNLRNYTSGPVILKCVPRGCLAVSLRDFLAADYARGDANWNLRETVCLNLLKIVPPVTTRAPRDGETDKKDYCFVSLESFSEMEKDGLLLQMREYDGHFYGILKPDVNDELATYPEIADFRDRAPFKRNESFLKALGMATDDSFTELLEKDDSPRPLRNQVVQRKPKEGRPAFMF